MAQICPKRNLGLEIQKTNVGIRISIFEIPYVPLLKENKKLWLFGLKFAQKWFLGPEFQKYKSGFGINTWKITGVPYFIQNVRFWIFWPKFGEIAQLRAIFWFKHCWGCCRQLVGVWNELGGGWNELGGGEWSRMELGGGVWSWVEVGARFSNTQ